MHAQEQTKKNVRKKTRINKQEKTRTKRNKHQGYSALSRAKRVENSLNVLEAEKFRVRFFLEAADHWIFMFASLYLSVPKGSVCTS